MKNLAIFRTHVVDFRRPGHIFDDLYDSSSITTPTIMYAHF